MIPVSVKFLGAIAAVLVSVLGVLATYTTNVNVSVGPPVAFGAVPTLDGVDFPFININGRREWQGAVNVTATSSAICVLKNPFQAPAIIADVKVNLTTNTFGIVNYDVSTSTNGFATSTNILGRFVGLAAGTATRYDWTPKVATTSAQTSLNGFQFEVAWDENLSSRMVLGANEYLIVRAATTSVGGSTFGAGYNVGQCPIKLEKI